MAAALPPIPLEAPVTEDKTFVLTQDWWRWIDLFIRRFQKCAQTLKAIALTGQTAAIVTSNLYTTLEAGVYRVSYAMRVTTPATTSSSLTITIGWSDAGVALSQSGAALTGNLVTSQQNGSFLVRCDGGSIITYAEAYASVGGTSMIYKCDLTVELVS